MIKNLLFDLGGVIMDIDRMNCVRAFRALGFENIEEFLGDYGQKGAFALLESGKISPAEFRDTIRQYIPHRVSDAQIDEAFEAFLIGIPRRRLEVLRSLRERYHLYLLSNTNAIMWNSFIRRSFEQEGRELGDYFDGTVTSFEARSLKPSPEIFELCASKLAINPAETLFLDDSAANCEAARQCGYEAAQVKPGVEFDAILRELGLWQ